MLGMFNFTNLFYYLTYFCYYLWVLLHFLILFIGPIVLFQLTFTFIYDTFSKKFSIIFVTIYGSYYTFDTIHRSYYTISTNFYLYLQYFQ